MAATTTAPAFSPTRRYLPLWTWEGRRHPPGRLHLAGKMHLAKVKSTKKLEATAWCGRTFFTDTSRTTVTGEHAALLLAAEEQPTCALCLERAGAWEWDW